MIGTVVKRKRDRAVFRVVGRDGGQLVIAPVEHGGALAVSELELRELFSVVNEAEAHPQPRPTVTPLGMSEREAAGRESLRADLERQATMRARQPQGRVPEDVFNSKRLGPSGR